MHTYLKTDGGWSVGYWRGERWESLRDFADEKNAAEFASFLNGGFPPRQP